MNDASGMWRAGFTVEGDAVLDLLDELEALALACSIYEAAADAEDRTTAWRVELLFDVEPRLASVEGEVAPILARAGLPPPVLDVAPVVGEDWLTAPSLRRPPLRVGRFLVHGAHDRDRVPEGQVGIEVEAGLAFGSGEHQTTHACLEALDGLLRRRRPREVLDMGCGSGILGIAALRAGSRRALLVDNDPVAVAVARANLRHNRVAGRGRSLVSDGYAAVRGRFDLVFANILADPLIDMAGHLRRHLAPGGMAVLSGLLDRQAPAVVAAHRARGLRLVARHDRTPWVALVFAKTGGASNGRG